VGGLTTTSDALKGGSLRFARDDGWQAAGLRPPPPLKFGTRFFRKSPNSFRSFESGFSVNGINL
jgi:hypothetical protein